MFLNINKIKMIPETKFDKNFKMFKLNLLQLGDRFTPLSSSPAESLQKYESNQKQNGEYAYFQELKQTGL